MTAWADHGQDGNGEPLAIVLRPGNAASKTAADHIEAARLALAQLLRHLRWPGAGPDRFRRRHARVPPLADRKVAVASLLRRHDHHRGHARGDPHGPAASWIPAYDGNGQVRDGAWVADITGMLDLASWPAGMRVIVRKERPHLGAQLRLTDVDGHRFTAFAIDARRGQLAGLELWHRRRARYEDRIRGAKDTVLRNLPLKGLAQNQLWCEIVAPACELLAWAQMLALTGVARRWEPERLRLRLFAVAGRLARGGRRLRLRLAANRTQTTDITAAFARLQALPSG